MSVLTYIGVVGYFAGFAVLARYNRRLIATVILLTMLLAGVYFFWRGSSAPEPGVVTAYPSLLRSQAFFAAASVVGWGAGRLWRRHSLG